MVKKRTQGYGVGGPSIGFSAAPIVAERDPATTDTNYNLGQQWINKSNNTYWILLSVSGGSATWDEGGNSPATTTTYGTVLLTDNSEPVATKVYADNLAIAGSPVATETTSGIGKLVSDANAVARIASTGLQAYFVQPSNLTAVMSSPGPIGNTLPDSGDFTGLTADGTGVVTLASSGDATISTATGSFVVSAGESAADAVKIESTAGGVQILASGAAAGEDIVLTATGSSIHLTATESAIDSINIESTLGGVRILASGAAAGEDIVVTATGSSVVITSTENAADSIVLSSTNGGIDITAAGAAAGEDIDISANGSSINLVATENAAQTIYLHANGGTSETIELRADQGTNAASIALTSDVGGVTITGGLGTADAINIVASDTAGGIDIDAGTGGIAADTTGSVVVTSTANSAASIFFHANGGTSETIRLHADQGTAVTSLDLLSDVGGITLRGGLGTADAINITATNAAGGIDIDSGTGGFIVDSTGPASIDVSGASNFTVATGDLSLIATLSSVNITANEDVADAVVITSAAGGIDVLATGAAGQDIDIVNTGGSVNISATENDAGAITILTNGGTSEKITVTASQGTDVASIGLISTAGGVTITGGLATADAININTSNAGGGIDVDAGTAGFIVDTTGAVSLDSATASNFTVTGAADLTLSSSAGAVNVTSGEANADSINVTSGGGMNIVATGAAAKDTIITNTNGSMTLTAGESVLDAMNFTASGAAGGINLTAGTNGILLSSGQKVKVTSVATAASPYTVLGTDYFITTDSTGGALTLTLPASPATGRAIVVYDGVGQAGGNAVTIDGNGKNIAASGTSAATKTVATAYGSKILTYNGTLWLGQTIA